MIRSRHQAFFDALKQSRHGQLTVIAPDGNPHLFGDSKAELDAQWKINDWRAIDETVTRGQLGFAEGYLDRQWESDDLTKLITFMLRNSDVLEDFFKGHPWHWLRLKLTNLLSRNSPTASRRNVVAHYDLGNDFYQLWLDASMTYSCALFAGENRTLEEAQQAKYSRILDKLKANPGEHILEIGCGWGGFAEAAAKRGFKVTGITLSDEQARYAIARMKRQGFDPLVNIELQDYRTLNGQFDHVVSIGMFEHVGQQYWSVYFESIKRLLKPGGVAMVQSITLDDTLFEELGSGSGFIEKYIFPGGKLPSKPRFAQCAEQAGLVCKEMFAFGADYAHTLEHWLQHFEAHLNEVRALGYDERFIRIWRFYLCGCIAAFSTERTDVMQVQLRHAA